MEASWEFSKVFWINLSAGKINHPLILCIVERGCTSIDSCEVHILTLEGRRLQEELANKCNKLQLVSLVGLIFNEFLLFVQ